MGSTPAVLLGLDAAALSRFEATADLSLPEEQRVAGEMRKLGANAEARARAADNFLRQTVFPHEYPAIKAAATTAAAVLTIEKKMAETQLRRWYPQNR